MQPRGGAATGDAEPVFRAFQLLASGHLFLPPRQRVHLIASSDSVWRAMKIVVLVVLALASACVVGCATPGPSPVKQQLEAIAQNDKRQTQAIREAAQRCKTSADETAIVRDDAAIALYKDGQISHDEAMREISEYARELGNAQQHCVDEAARQLDAARGASERQIYALPPK
jgi:hypothetical protein